MTYVVQGRHGQKPQTVHVSVDSKGKGGGLVDRVFLFLLFLDWRKGRRMLRLAGASDGLVCLVRGDGTNA